MLNKSAFDSKFKTVAPHNVADSIQDGTGFKFKIAHFSVDFTISTPSFEKKTVFKKEEERDRERERKKREREREREREEKDEAE